MNEFLTVASIGALIGLLLGIFAVRRMRGHTLVGGVSATFCLTLGGAMFAFLAWIMTNHIVAQLTYPTYVATTIDYKIGHSSDSAHYIPILQFTDDTGQIVTRRGHRLSSDPPTIGGTTEVYYKNGKMYEPSFVTYVTMVLFMLVSGYFLTYALFYAMRWNHDFLLSVGIYGLIYGLMPGLFLLGIGNIIWAILT